MRILILAMAAFLGSVPVQATEFNAPIEALITGFVRPQMTLFASTVAQLPGAVEAVCDDTNEATKSRFRAAFADTVETYSRIHFLRFGPMLDEDRASRLAFLPDPRGIVQRQIRKIYAAKDEAVLASDTLAKKSVAVQGLSALELVAFDKSSAVRLGEKADKRDFTCEYALAISQNVALIAEEAAADWRDPEGYTATLLNSGPDNASYRSSKEALEAIFNSLATGIVIAKDQDVLPVLGSSEAKAKPRRFPFSRSGNAIAYLSGELEGIRQAIAAMDLEGLTPEEHAWLLNTIDFEFGNAQTYLKKLQPPVRQTFKTNNNYGDMKALSITLESIRELLAQELAGALRLAGGFNALDGD